MARAYETLSWLVDDAHPDMCARDFARMISARIIHDDNFSVARHTRKLAFNRSETLG